MKKTFQKLASVFVLGIALLTACNEAPPVIKDASILPIPVSLKQDNTSFVLTKQTTIGINDPQLKPAAEYLAKILSPATGYSFKVAEGEGNINFDRVFEKAEAGGTQYMLVEQDNCNGEDPFDCLRRSYEYLKAEGFE